MYKNYIFDLYGTLIDIKTDEYSNNFYKKYAKWLRKNGYAYEWKKFRKIYLDTENKYRTKAKDMSKYSNPEIDIRDVFKEILKLKNYRTDEETVNNLCEGFRNISVIYRLLYPDTIECLESLQRKGKKIYLLSNAQRSFTWQELEMLDLIKYFDGILISSDEGCMKPDPEFYNICMNRYGLKQSESLMIGNELESDIKGAVNAGIDSFYINRKSSCEKDIAGMCTYISKKGSLMEVVNKTLE